MTFNLSKLIRALNNEGVARTELQEIIASATPEAPDNFFSLSEILIGLNNPGKIRNQVAYVLQNASGSELASYFFNKDRVLKAINNNGLYSDVVFTFASRVGSDGGDPDPEPLGQQELLIVGHSLADNPLTQIMDQLVQEYNAGDIAHMQNIVGSPLFYNYDNAATANGNAHGRFGDTSGNGVARLAAGGVNALVLTEAGPFIEAYRASDTMSSIPEWVDTWTDAEYDELRTFLYQIWPPIPDYATTPDWEAWRDKIDNTQYAYDYIVNRLELAGYPITLIPVDMAFKALSLAVEGGTVPGLTDMLDIFYTDEIHINPLGFYFVAMCIYATVYGVTPVGLPYDVDVNYSGPIPELTEAMATRFQEIAWAAVQAHPWAGIAERPTAARTWTATPLVGDSWAEWPTVNTQKDITVDVGAAASGRTLVFYAGNYEGEIGATATFNPLSDNITCETVFRDIDFRSRAIYAVNIPAGLSGNQTLRITANNFYTTTVAYTIVNGIGTTATQTSENAILTNVPVGSFVFAVTQAGAVSEIESQHIYMDDTLLEVQDSFQSAIGYGESAALLPTVTINGDFSNAIVVLPPL